MTGVERMRAWLASAAVLALTGAAAIHAEAQAPDAAQPTSVLDLALDERPITPATDLADAARLSEIARAAFDEGDPVGAASALAAVAAFLETSSEAAPGELAGVTADYAGVLEGLGAAPLAAEAYRLAAERYERALGPGADATLTMRDKQARLLQAVGRDAESRVVLNAAVSAAAAAPEVNPRALVTMRALAAYASQRAGDGETALNEAQALLDTTRELFGAASVETYNLELDVAVYLRELGRFEDAIDAFETAEATARALPEPGRRIADAAYEVARALAASQRGEAGLVALDRSLVEAERAGLSEGDRLVIRSDRADLLWSLGRLTEAEAEKRAVAEGFAALEAADGSNLVHAEVGLIRILVAQERIDDAIARGQALVARIEAAGGAPAALAFVLHEIGMTHRARSDCAGARPNFERAAEILRAEPGATSGDVAANLTLAGECAGLISDYAAAVALLDDAVSFATGADGPTGPTAIQALTARGYAQTALGRYAQAQESYRQVQTLFEAGQGDVNARTTFAVNYAQLLIRLGDFAGAETLLEQARALLVENDQARTLSMMGLLNVLADISETNGDFDAAERLLREAADIARAEGDAKDARPGVAVGNLASFLARTDRHDEAQALFDESRELVSAVLGPDSPEMAGLHHNLGRAYIEQERFEEAERELRRSREIMLAAVGDQHRDYAATLNALARLYDRTGDYDQAASVLAEAQAIVEATVGAENLDAARNLIDIAKVERRRGRYDAAHEAAGRAFEIIRARFGDGHVNLVEPAIEITQARRNLDASPSPLDAALIDTLDAALDRGWAAVKDRSIDKAALRRAGSPESAAIDALTFFEGALAIGAIAGDDAERLEAAFGVAQAFGGSSASEALAAAAARLSIGDAEKQDLLRQRETQTARLSLFERQLAAMRDRPIEERVAAEETLLEAEIATVRRSLGDTVDRLEADDADFAEIAAGRGLSVAAVQALLRPEEALVVFSAADPEGRVVAFAIRADRAVAAAQGLEVEDLAETVKRLRLGLTPPASGRVADLAAYDLGAAQVLKKQLFDPLAQTLSGAERLLVVAEGPLASLPLHVLVSEPGEGEGAFGRYRSTRWFGDDYALAMLPAVSSLKALRDGARPSAADRPLLGFGDPVIPRAAEEPPPLEAPAADGALEDPFAVIKQMGGEGDLAALSALPPLKETATLLTAVADRLGARETDLFLGEEAQEEELRLLQERDRLKRYRIVAFATHALVAGELKGLGLIEPALVLSAPGGDASDPSNDGLLRASEAVELDFDADLVVLAACNTAAADGSPGAEALSGLARAFFYAGARALLVSHWPAEATATATLVPAMTDAMSDGAPRAEALASAIALVRDDPDRAYFAHPALWAPFVVVGEGG